MHGIVDRFIKVALEKHPRLVFNADETEIGRKASFFGKVAWNEKKQPRIAAKDRSGHHVTMFLIISRNELVKPSFLLHGGPDFVSQHTLFEDEVVCIKTSNGYMEKWTFKSIMIHHFKSHVQKVREELGTDERAALIVDGHSSSYDLETFQALNEAGIDLIILPAHSSHITQPLDITLNGILKKAFPFFYRKGVPKSVLDDIKSLNESGKKYKSKQELFVKLPDVPKPVVRNRSEDDTNLNDPPRKRRRSNSSAASRSTKATQPKTKKASKPRKRVQRKPRKINLHTNAAMDRLRTICAVIDALKSLTSFDIISSWRATGLHPFTVLLQCRRKTVTRC